MLGSLIPYGDAVFNHRQVPVLISELKRLADRGILTETEQGLYAQPQP
ncbi:hypothetical protein ABZZ74_51495 [Streptomyces sp. NPDC006476]